MKKRSPLTFDTKHFSQMAERGMNLSVEDTFKEIYTSNHWANAESVSGEGSGSEQTVLLRSGLAEVFSKYKIKTILDLPCGDFAWMKDVAYQFDRYIGGDIVDSIIEKNGQLYTTPNREFRVLNLIEDLLPKTDLVFCRDCLVHLSLRDALTGLRNMKNSGATYLMATTFPECDYNEDIITGDWRVLNLELAPFNLGVPIELLNEGCTEGDGTYSDKSLGLWILN